MPVVTTLIVVCHAVRGHRDTAVLQLEVGRAMLGSAFGGTLEQFVQVLAA